jgi:hypothetical protein
MSNPPARRRPGRPPVGDPRKKRPLSLNNAEWAALKAEAARNGLTVAAWVRLRCIPPLEDAR